jgi:hypothetical protein
LVVTVLPFSICLPPPLPHFVLLLTLIVSYLQVYRLSCVVISSRSTHTHTDNVISVLWDVSSVFSRLICSFDLLFCCVLQAPPSS